MFYSNNAECGEIFSQKAIFNRTGRKILYYKTVGEKDPSKIQNIKCIAKSMGIDLNEATISILQNSKYSGHIEAIARMNQADNWNKEIIEGRRDNLLDIIWDRIIKWLN